MTRRASSTHTTLNTLVVDLSLWQDVPAQHTRYSAGGSVVGPCRRQRLELVEKRLHSSRLSRKRTIYARGMTYNTLLHAWSFLFRTCHIIRWPKNENTSLCLVVHGSVDECGRLGLNQPTGSWGVLYSTVIPTYLLTYLLINQVLLTSATKLSAKLSKLHLSKMFVVSAVICNRELRNPDHAMVS